MTFVSEKLGVFLHSESSFAHKQVKVLGTVT